MIKSESICVFLIGGTVYSLIEILFRGFTHWTMVIVGGLCFLCLYNIHVRTNFSLLNQCLIGTAAITTIEFIAGYIVNIRLKWNIWDYSSYSYNLLGQICPLYIGGWFLLCFPGIWLAKFVYAFLYKVSLEDYKE